MINNLVILSEKFAISTSLFIQEEKVNDETMKRSLYFNVFLYEKYNFIMRYFIMKGILKT